MERKQTVTEKSLEYWEKKANCARASVCGILTFNDKESLCDPFYKAMLPMGGGFGEGLVCGAVTGSLAALSLILAEKGLEDKEIAKKVKIWKKDFKDKFETFTCYELIDEFRDESGKIDLKMPGRREKCTEIVISGVTSTQQIINSIK
ncbi:MAG: C_GCAxxG_C_C family protein [Candidatus Heimdallarchaeota archaeon]|nr:MAG: C_GCAxxG_C_C family protein [Candidatus Heimdallarchaeota archaeon]